MSEVRLSVVADDAVDALAQLSSWLRQEPDLRGRVSFAAEDPRPGVLGSSTDALVVAVGGGGAISVLAASLKTFLSLPRRSDVRIKIHETSNGRTVELDVKRVADVEAVIRGVLGSASEDSLS